MSWLFGLWNMVYRTSGIKAACNSCSDELYSKWNLDCRFGCRKLSLTTSRSDGRYRVCAVQQTKSSFYYTTIRTRTCEDFSRGLSAWRKNIQPQNRK